MLGVYELNKVDLLKDVFIWAYERSAERYAAVRQSLGDPDPFRQRHREALRQLVGGFSGFLLSHFAERSCQQESGGCVYRRVGKEQYHSGRSRDVQGHGRVRSSRPARGKFRSSSG